jgi:hypothetical protein
VRHFHSDFFTEFSNGRCVTSFTGVDAAAEWPIEMSPRGGVVAVDDEPALPLTYDAN